MAIQCLHLPMGVAAVEKEWKVIEGNREQMEWRVLEAIVTGDPCFDELLARLKPAGAGKLHLISAGQLPEPEREPEAPLP